MPSIAKILAITATSCAFLVACGGGNDDDPTPSNEPGVFTVTDATLPGTNGIYGNGALNLTDVDKKNPIGSDPEVCTFKFDGAHKLGSDATALGDIRYQPGYNVLHAAYLTFAGREYSINSSDNTAVLRERDQIRFDGKTLIATDGSNHTVRVSGIVPMRGNRPAGC